MTPQAITADLPGERRPPPAPEPEPEPPVPTSRNAIDFADAGKRALRRFRSNKALDEAAETALLTVYFAMGLEATAFKTWLTNAASPVIDREVHRVAALPGDEFNHYARRALDRLREVKNGR